MELDFSFCIITDNSHLACQRIAQTIQSIRALKIPKYEILIIGGQGNKFSGNLDDIQKIDFDESIKPGWITKKKNDVVKMAKYDNLVICHDYFVFHSNWYKGYLKIYNDFKDCDVCCNPIFMIDGRRDFTDWVTLDHPEYGIHRALNYNDWDNTKSQYISGGYFVIKRKFFLENPQDEDMVHGQPEDVMWSLSIRNKAKIICNPYSYNQHNKEHRNLRVNLWQRLD